MKMVEDYFIKYHESGIVSLTINTKERWVYCHQFCDEEYLIQDKQGDNYTKEDILKIEDLVLDQNKRYVRAHQQNKDQISFYFIPFDLIMDGKQKEMYIKLMEKRSDER